MFWHIISLTLYMYSIIPRGIFYFTYITKQDIKTCYLLPAARVSHVVSSSFLFRDYVSSKMINKLIQVHDRIFACIAGSLADAQAVTKAAKFQLAFHRCRTRTHQHSSHFESSCVFLNSSNAQCSDGDASSGDRSSICTE